MPVLSKSASIVAVSAPLLLTRSPALLKLVAAPALWLRKIVSLRTSNAPPERLLIVHPFLRASSEVNTTVPLLFNVRVSKYFNEPGSILVLQVGERLNAPLPLMVPMVQSKNELTVMSPVPVISPPLWFRVTISVVSLKVMVPLEIATEPVLSVLNTSSKTAFPPSTVSAPSHVASSSTVRVPPVMFRLDPESMLTSIMLLAPLE